MNDWFTIDKIDGTSFIISEYRHPEETHCYLLIGNERCLLIDTGLGVCNIYDEVRKLTDKPATAIATHIHWVISADTNISPISMSTEPNWIG